jgi:ribose transport system ATP-binding protein
LTHTLRSSTAPGPDSEAEPGPGRSSAQATGTGLRARDIHKRFDAVVALSGASVTLRPGEIRALFGGNGSGKSTLMKIISGVLRPDRGVLTLDDQPVFWGSPRDAFAKGVAVAYQELSVLPNLSVAENLLVGGGLPSRAGLVDRRTCAAKVREVLSTLGREEIVDTLVADLPLADQYLVEFAKALMARPRFLLLDEVTSALRREQVERIRAIVRDLRTGGAGVLFVSHRVDEIYQLCETVTVLRNGEVVSEGSLRDVTAADLVSAVMPPGAGSRPPAGTLTGPDEAPSGESEPGTALRATVALPEFGTSVTLAAARGEIVGLAGLQGQGQSTILRALCGCVAGATAVVDHGERRVNVRSPVEAVAEGFGFISGDRQEMVFLERSIKENLHVVSWVSGRRLEAAGLLQRLGLAHTDVDRPVRGLSGGNQQKVVVARWLGVRPAVMLADDPTRGVDVGTRGEIHAFLRDMARQGSVVLFSSSQDSELATLCDRICVLFAGKIVRELTGGGITEDEIVTASLGAATG